MRIAVAGSGLLAVAVMEPLLEAGHSVVALVQNGRLVRGFQRRVLAFKSRFTHGSNSPLRLAALERIPVLWLDTMSHGELAPIAAVKPDLLITCGFSIILKRPLLELPQIGCINIHSSLLSRHRGPNPFSHVILAGEDETGVTFHVTAAGVDTGDILDQTPFLIGPDDTAMSVYVKACEITRARIVPVIQAIDRHGLDGVPQDQSDATYDKLIGEEGMRIDWAQPAARIHRLVRALHQFGFARFFHRGRLVFLATAAHDDAPVPQAPGTVIATRPHVVVATGLGSLTIGTAMITTPVTWYWPPPWQWPKVGERLR